jgi:hypothetical protein
VYVFVQVVVHHPASLDPSEVQDQLQKMTSNFMVKATGAWAGLHCVAVLSCWCSSVLVRSVAAACSRVHVFQHVQLCATLCMCCCVASLVSLDDWLTRRVGGFGEWYVWMLG